MSVVQLMVTIIIVTILVTVVLGVVSYAAYWLRRSRRPGLPQLEQDNPHYFFCFKLEDEAATPGAEGEGAKTGADLDALLKLAR
jgi:hypothetical protein